MEKEKFGGLGYSSFDNVLIINKTLGLIMVIYRPGIVIQTYNLSTLEVEAKES